MNTEQTITNIEITQVREEHLEAVAVFFSKVWGKKRVSIDEIKGNQTTQAQLNPVFPGKTFPAFIFIKDSVIIGYIGTIPTRFWNGNEELTAYWMKGFMVLEEYQNGPIGFYLLKEAMKHIELAGVLTVAPASRRLFEAIGFKKIGVLENYIALVKPQKVLNGLDLETLGMSGLSRSKVTGLKILQKTKLAYLAGYTLKLFFFFWKRLNLPSISPYTVEYAKTIREAPGIDELWQVVKKKVNFCAVRDRKYLAWRYDRDNLNYEYVLVSKNNKLCGIAIVRKPKEIPDERLSGLKVASYSDFIFNPDEEKAGMILFNAAQILAGKLGADALLCSISHKNLSGILKKTSYFRLPGNVNFLLKKPDGSELSEHLNQWWLTRGDASSDEAF